MTSPSHQAGDPVTEPRRVLIEAELAAAEQEAAK